MEENNSSEASILASPHGAISQKTPIFKEIKFVK
jgi:hypothetical protein